MFDGHVPGRRRADRVKEETDAGRFWNSDPTVPQDLGDQGPHHGGDVVDLNAAPEDWLARLPELGPERARMRAC